MSRRSAAIYCLQPPGVAEAGTRGSPNREMLQIGEWHIDCRVGLAPPRPHAKTRRTPRRTRIEKGKSRGQEADPLSRGETGTQRTKDRRRRDCQIVASNAKSEKKEDSSTDYAGVPLRREPVGCTVPTDSLGASRRGLFHARDTFFQSMFHCFFSFSCSSCALFS
jgi:hypothetical protein